jgi:hypothetical protein
MDTHTLNHSVHARRLRSWISATLLGVAVLIGGPGKTADAAPNRAARTHATPQKKTTKTAASKPTPAKHASTKTAPKADPAPVAEEPAHEAEPVADKPADKPVSHGDAVAQASDSETPPTPKHR